MATPAIWFGLAGSVLAFVLWIAILQGSELTRAFTLQGATFATVPLAGWLIFGEQISLARAAGIALIIVGVTLISQRRCRGPLAPAAAGTTYAARRARRS